ncbi:MAG: cation transporter [Candidatus Izemoplasmatales bacterium]
MKEIKLSVNGMNCQHCVNNIKSGLSSLNGIEKVNVILKEKIVDVKYNESTIDFKNIVDKISELGYRVIL